MAKLAPVSLSNMCMFHLDIGRGGGGGGGGVEVEGGGQELPCIHIYMHTILLGYEAAKTQAPPPNLSGSIRPWYSLLPRPACRFRLHKRRKAGRGLGTRLPLALDIMTCRQTSKVNELYTHFRAFGVEVEVAVLCLRIQVHGLDGSKCIPCSRHGNTTMAWQKERISFVVFFFLLS